MAAPPHQNIHKRESIHDGICERIVLTTSFSVRLLFHPASSKNTIYDFIGINSDCFCPFAETVAVPFQIFLMIWRHTFEHRGILLGTPTQAFMKSNSPELLNNFNCGVCHSHIDRTFDKLIRHRMLHLVYGDVVVKLYCGGTMFS